MKIAKKQVVCFVLLAVVGFSALNFVKPAQANLWDLQIGVNEVGNVYGDTEPEDIRITVGKIINIVLGFLGIIFVGLALVAGFRYMTAAGNEEKTKEALALIKNAVIGLVIVLMAWGITRFAIIKLGKAANNSIDQSYSAY